MLPLAEELWDGSLWDLPFKLQSSVCFPDVARSDGSRILPLTHNYSSCNMQVELFKTKSKINKAILPTFYSQRTGHSIS
jgi:hypothetical protein